MTRDLRQIDLNLLRHLGDLLETAHVTRAAERAGIAQPAMSRSLAKLRVLFRDPLLVPVGRRLELSQRASALRPKVQEMLAATRHVFDEPEAFDPQQATGLVRIAAHDYTVGPVITRAILTLRTLAPRLAVHVAQATLDSLAALAEGELDFVIGPTVAGAERAGVDRFVVRPFADATPSCVMRKNHPSLKKRWDVGAFCRAEHVIISTERPGPSPIDEALSRIGARRNSVLAVPSVGAALSIVAQSELIAVVPAAHLEDYGLALTTRPLPFAFPNNMTFVVWSPRKTQAARHQWLRSQLFAAARRSGSG